MSEPILVSDSNVSIAWVKALKSILSNRDSPLCISITNLEDGIKEDVKIRHELDRLLKKHGQVSVRETSETLFPYGYWLSKQPSASDLASWYIERYLPRHRARVRAVKAGTPQETYFERLIAYPGFTHSGNGGGCVKINQLERIVRTFNHYHALGKNPSPSKFIATCLNPSIDNTNMTPYFPFPCLQQLGFLFTGGKITVTGFYSIQYLMKRGYGNYLGLCYIGEFMSKETGLPLHQMNCFVGNPRVDGFRKSSLNNILSFLN